MVKPQASTTAKPSDSHPAKPEAKPPDSTAAKPWASLRDSLRASRNQSLLLLEKPVYDKIPLSQSNGPATPKRPGPGIGGRSSHAVSTICGEAFAVSAHRPIDGHPGFYRRGRRVYFRFKDRRGRNRWDSGATLKEAQRKKIERELEVERGDYRDGSRQTFESYARSWIDTYAGRTSRGVTETTRDDYRRRLEQDAIPFLGKTRLVEIEQRDLKEYVRHLEKQGKAPNTVRLAVAPVRALLATAIEEGLLRSNPAAGLRLAQRRPESVDGDDPEEQVKAMSEQQLADVLAAVAELAPTWLLFFRFLFWSGLRIGEAVELRWKDVDLGERIVHVRRRWHSGRVGPPKSKYGKRRLKLTPDLAQALWRLRGESRAFDDDLVFPNSTGNRIHQSNLLRRVLKPAAIAAGLGEWVRQEDGRLKADSWVSFHTFRHTCATTLFRRGWNAVQVQRWLGHHKPSFTLDTYVHLLDEDVPEPTFFDRITRGIGTPGCDTDVTQTGSNRVNSAPLPAASSPHVSIESGTG
jgi:integrase